MDGHLPKDAVDIALRAPFTDGALTASIVWSLRHILWPLGGLTFAHVAAWFFTRKPPSLGLECLGMNLMALLLWLVVGGRKARVREQCNILYLRGFRQELRANALDRTIPSIGGYGRVMSLANVLQKSKAQDSVGPLRGDDLTDASDGFAFSSDWHQAFEERLAKADVAVIDFSILSESLCWEIKRCLEQLPPDRIVLIVELHRNAQNLLSNLWRRFPKLLDVPGPIPVYPSRFVIPLAFWRWWFFQYERKLHARMKFIAQRTADHRLSPEATTRA
jgi:hypothetical protein